MIIVRWLAIRLDFLGAIMVFIVRLVVRDIEMSAPQHSTSQVSLFAVGTSEINPAQIGLVLTYASECA